MSLHASDEAAAVVDVALAQASLISVLRAASSRLSLLKNPRRRQKQHQERQHRQYI